jgi:hypothetical protein
VNEFPDAATSSRRITMVTVYHPALEGHHMRYARAVFQTALFVVSSASIAVSQGMPTSQPSMLTITREDVKTGHNAMHAAFEAGWPAAYTKAKSPYYYLAMVAMTGPNESWYVSPYASHAAYGESMKMESDDKALTAEIARLQKGDADHINSVRSMHAVARTDLSYGAYPDMAMARFFEITIFRVRPGFEEGFASAAKAYAAAAKRAAPNMSWRTYEVIAGLPGPTYLVFSSVQSFAEFDRSMAQGMAIGKAFTPDELATMEKFSTAGMINAETQRFRVDPKQSYVDGPTKDKDKAFWNQK